MANKYNSVQFINKLKQRSNKSLDDFVDKTKNQISNHINSGNINQRTIEEYHKKLHTLMNEQNVRKINGFKGKNREVYRSNLALDRIRQRWEYRTDKPSGLKTIMNDYYIKLIGIQSKFKRKATKKEKAKLLKDSHRKAF